MKTPFLILTFILATSCLYAAASNDPADSGLAPQIVAPLPLDQGDDAALTSQLGITVTFPTAPDGSKTLSISYPGPDTTQMGIVTVPPNLLQKITAARFGIAGEVKCSATISLGMGVSFIPRADLTPQSDEPRTAVQPTTEWHAFELQIDRGQSGLILNGLNLSTGLVNWPVTVELRNLRLIQYPVAPLPPEAGPGAQTSTDLEAEALTASFVKAQDDLVKLKTDLAEKSAYMKPEHPAMIALKEEIKQQEGLLEQLRGELQNHSGTTSHWRAYVLGMATTASVLFFLAVGSFLFRLARRRSHERELRRIASLDS